MRMQRARGLARDELVGRGQRLLDEQRLRIDHAVDEAIDVELVLALARDIDERQRRVKLEMARPEAETAVGRDRGAVGELAVLEGEEFQRAGILWLVPGLVVAAAHQDRGVVIRRGANMGGENPAIERGRLRHLFAEAAIGIDAMYRDAARIVVGGEREAAAAIDR